MGIQGQQGAAEMVAGTTQFAQADLELLGILTVVGYYMFLITAIRDQECLECLLLPVFL